MDDKKKGAIHFALHSILGTAMHPVWMWVWGVLLSVVAAITGWLGPEGTLVAYGAAGVFAVIALVKAIQIVRRRAASPDAVPMEPPRPEPKSAEISGQARLVDSLALDPDTVRMRLLRRHGSNNQGEIISRPPADARHLIKQNGAVEYYSDLAGAVDRILFELDRLKRAYGQHVKDRDHLRAAEVTSIGV